MGQILFEIGGFYFQGTVPCSLQVHTFCLTKCALQLGDMVGRLLDLFGRLIQSPLHIFYLHRVITILLLQALPKRGMLHYSIYLNTNGHLNQANWEFKRKKACATTCLSLISCAICLFFSRICWLVCSVRLW